MRRDGTWCCGMMGQGFCTRTARNEARTAGNFPAHTAQDWHHHVKLRLQNGFEGFQACVQEPMLFMST